MSEAAYPELLRVLKAAVSQCPNSVKQAEGRLQLWEAQPGFYQILARVAVSTEIQFDMRWIAVLYFKNSVDRHWRNSSPNGISFDERQDIRSLLLCCLKEPVPQIALQMTVLIARIARHDYPQEWPQLVPVLLDAARSSHQLQAQRALMTLYRVVKTLASRRLMAGQSCFRDLAAVLTPSVCEIWCLYNRNACESGSDPSVLECARFSLKSLRYLIVHGFRRPHVTAEVVIAMDNIIKCCQELILIRNRMTQCVQLFEKYIILHTKLLLDVLENHPLFYAPYIKRSLEFCATVLFTGEGQGLLFERLTIQCLTFMEKILTCHERRPQICVDGFEDSIQEVRHINSEFFSSQTLERVVTQLVTSYIPLTSDDLQAWAGNPEVYFCEECEVSRFMVRSFSEQLFVSLFRLYKSRISPILVTMMEDTLTRQVGSDISQLISRDAIYNVVGLAAGEFYDTIDFESWLSSRLLTELANKESNYRVVRRRVIWLIGQWVGVNISNKLRQDVYRIILNLLRDEDLVVRLTSAQTLKDIVDDFEFRPADFLVFTKDMVVLLFHLLKEVGECDTKLRVLNVLSSLIERMGSEIRPFCDGLVTYLPQLWEDSVDHSMLRVVIISTLVHLIRGLGSECSRLYPLLIPIIQLSTDLYKQDHVFLMEDGLALWQATMENTTAMHTELFQLYRNVLPILELGSDSLEIGFAISHAYLLLSPEPFLLQFGPQLVKECNNQLPHSKPDHISIILRFIENAVRVHAELALSVFSSVLPWVLRSLVSSEHSVKVLALLLCLLARLTLRCQGMFGSLVKAVAAECGLEFTAMLEKLLDVWMMQMPCIGQVERRKLLALALCSLLSVFSVSVAGHIPLILRNVVETLNDVMQPDSDVDLLYTTNGTEQLSSNGDQGCETAHDARCLTLTYTDPVHTTVLKDVFLERLGEMRCAVGESGYKKLMAGLDAETHRSLSVYNQV